MCIFYISLIENTHLKNENKNLLSIISALNKNHKPDDALRHNTVILRQPRCLSASMRSIRWKETKLQKHNVL